MSFHPTSSTISATARKTARNFGFAQAPLPTPSCGSVVALSSSNNDSNDSSSSSSLPWFVDPGTKGGAVVLSILLFALPLVVYNVVVAVNPSIDPLVVGQSIGVGFTVLSTVAWVSTYIFRVANKDMTYVRISNQSIYVYIKNQNPCTPKKRNKALLWIAYQFETFHDTNWLWSAWTCVCVPPQKNTRTVCGCLDWSILCAFVTLRIGTEHERVVDMCVYSVSMDGCRWVCVCPTDSFVFFRLDLSIQFTHPFGHDTAAMALFLLSSSPCPLCIIYRPNN